VKGIFSLFSNFKVIFGSTLPTQLKKYLSPKQIIQIVPRYIDSSPTNLKLIKVTLILMKINNKYNQYLEKIEKRSFIGGSSTRAY
jgi:hypothetical protein